MNRLELAIYNLLKKNPNLKLRTRNLYQRMCDLVPVKARESRYPFTVREKFFFGFHDKCPWSIGNSMLLGNGYRIPLRMPGPEDILDVGFFDGEDYRNFHKIGESTAWNWHQGCMLQWVGSSQNMIFNNFDGTAHCSDIVSVDGKLLARFDGAIGAISNDGKWGLGYDFARLRTYAPGYGYANGSDTEVESEQPQSHGISLLNLSSGDRQMLFSVRDIASVQRDPSMDRAFHYFTHCQFSPSGKRFVFFHRWIKNFNVLRTRMVSCSLSGGDLFVFPTDGMVSHVAWKNGREILAYARIDDYGDRYVLFRDQSSEFNVVGEKDFDSDGHPSFSPNKRWIVTDTYPDRFRQSRLILYDMETQSRFDLAKLRNPRRFASTTFENHWQCDLHPRWDRTGKMICFDSAYTGERALCTIRLNDDLVASEDPPKN